MMIAGYETHPAADLFPMLPESELSELAEDIGRRGLLEPVLLDDEDRVLDGRNRLLACEIAQVSVRFRRYDGDDPIGAAVSLNLKRRHLTPSQRALAAHRSRELYDAQAKERQGRRGLRAQETGDARDKVGEVFGVSGALVDRARTVVDEADPATITAIERGEETVTGALRKVKRVEPTADLTQRIQRARRELLYATTAARRAGLGSVAQHLQRLRADLERVREEM